MNLLRKLSTVIKSSLPRWEPVQPTKNVLFLCTGNSCRSQLGEALVNQYRGDEWRAYSAGTKPTGYVHPKAIEVLGELGISDTQLFSKNVDTLKEIKFDAVYTVCDSAAQECPIWLCEGGDSTTVTHIPYPDPALADATGTDEEITAVFRDVRDRIKADIVDNL